MIAYKPSLLSSEVLFEVLSFLRRSELDGLAAASRQLNLFTKKHFPNFPLNSVEGLLIRDCARPEHYFAVFNDSTSWPCRQLETLQGYASTQKFVVKTAILAISTPMLSLKWKQRLESISALWKNSKLVLEMTRNQEEDEYEILPVIFRWSKVLTCSHFKLKFCNVASDVPLYFHLFPVLYTFSIVEFVDFERCLRTTDLLAFLNNIPGERQHSLTVRLSSTYRWPKLGELLDLIKQSFVSSKLPCSYKLQICQPANQYDINAFFWLTNEVTTESLEYHFDRTEEDNRICVLRRSLT